MQTRDVVFPTGHALSADVGTPQVENLVRRSYQSEILSDKVSTGRAKSALNSEQVPECRMASEAPLEGWSRGCRRAHVSFWFWLRLQLWLLAPRRKSRCPSRSPRKSWTPASTSNLPERACRPWQGRPAPIDGLLRKGAVCRPDFPDMASASRYGLWAVPALSPIPAGDCHDRRQARC